MDDSVQFEEDFVSRNEMWSGQVRLSQTRPIPRSPDGDKNICGILNGVHFLLKGFVPSPHPWPPNES